MLVYTINKQGNRTLVYNVSHGVKGEKGDIGPIGPQGATGPQGIAATVRIGEVTSGTAPSVTNVGTENNAILDFVLEKGDTGETGPQGTAAGFGTPRASAHTVASGAEPSVTVSAEGPNVSKVFDFDFGIPQGPQGPQGEKGIKGDTGDAAGFGTPTISVTSLPSGSTPTATVSATGPDTAKVFDFDFGIPTGSNAWNIEVSYFTSSTMVLKAFKNNEAYSGTIFAYLTYGDGTTSQRTSSPMMLTATSGTITITSNEFSDIATVLADTTKTNFYFEFQETFTGSIFYTVNYVRNGAGGDSYSLKVGKINRGQYRTPYISLTVYKNGVSEKNTTFYGQFYYGDNEGNNMDSKYFSATTDNSGGITLGTTQISTLTNIFKNLENTQFIIMLFSDSNYSEYVASAEITHYLGGSVADNNKGYVNGDQVYDYVDTQVGNINTILQSI